MMKIAILSRGPDLYSTRRLQTACRARGHDVTVFDPLQFSIHVEQSKPHLHYGEEHAYGFNAVIPRIGASITFFGTAVVRQFEQMGVFCLNSAQAISTARDKLRAVQILSRHGLGIPKTEFVRQRSDVLKAIERVGGAPVIIKLLEGTQGVGVILAETVKSAEAIVETLQSTKQNVLIQKFVAESRGRDVRAIVVGRRVVAAMRRTAQAGEFRSNVHRGGRVEPLSLDEAFEQAAIQAAQILNLNAAGVDLLESRHGPLVMEVNASPGLEGIERATGIDVASHVIEYVEQRVRFPEIDVWQRLTRKGDYGIADVPVGDGSPIAGKRVNATGLRERDILILSITRGERVIPNPKGEREIQTGDMLLCFGKLDALRSLLGPG